MQEQEPSHPGAPHPAREPMLTAMRWRYATQQFDPARGISPKDLETLLEATCLTPSGFGLMPYRIFVVDRPDLREKLLAASWNQSQVADAAHLIVFAAMKTLPQEYLTGFVHLTAQTREQSVESLEKFAKGLTRFAQRDEAYLTAWASRQSYIALGTLLVAAAELRIDACPMEGFNAKTVDEALGLEALGLTATALCPIGYRAETDKYGHLPKVRYPLNEMVVRL